jgi:hypothetical protein
MQESREVARCGLFFSLVARPNLSPAHARRCPLSANSRRRLARARVGATRQLASAPCTNSRRCLGIVAALGILDDALDYITREHSQDKTELLAQPFLRSRVPGRPLLVCPTPQALTAKEAVGAAVGDVNIVRPSPAPPALHPPKGAHAAAQRCRKPPAGLQAGPRQRPGRDAGIENWFASDAQRQTKLRVTRSFKKRNSV